MPTIPNKKSEVVSFTGTNDAADDLTMPIPNSGHYRSFTISLPAALTVVTLQGEAGGGFLNLHTSAPGATQQITLQLDAVNSVELAAPCIGGLQLICRHAGGLGVVVQAHVTMAGSLYSEGRRH